VHENIELRPFYCNDVFHFKPRRKSTPALVVDLHLLFQLLFRDISKPNIKKTHNLSSPERKLKYFRAKALDKDDV
jgi:hypothetical protein